MKAIKFLLSALMLVSSVSVLATSVDLLHQHSISKSTNVKLQHSSTEVNTKPFVIPELRQWKGAKGVFDVNENTQIVYPKGNKALEKVANDFANDYKTMFNIDLKVVEGNVKKMVEGNIVFTIKDNKKLGTEGYTVDINKGVVITSPTVVGTYWATRTLLQISEQSPAHSLPKGFITDYPTYPVRGFMIDVGRKFVPISYLQSYIKLMSYYKMNYFQIHLNDNGFKQFFQDDWDKTYSAFRLESDTYPLLTARDGSYTKQEFIDLQILAENHFVNIIPEIDVPAHTLAFTHYKPSLGSKEYGMDHVDIMNPEVYPFFDALFKEYIQGDNPIFRGKIVHIGTDEYSNKDSVVVEKFREFTDHYIKFVEQYGKQACLWGSLTHAKGKTPVKVDNVIMQAWSNGYANPKEMAKLGYKLISIPDGYVYIVPAAGYYYDYLNTKHLYDNWTPLQVGNVKFDEADPAILGGMFAVWNDKVGNGISNKDIYHRVFPAMQTLACKCWDGANTTIPYDQFTALARNISEAPGVNELAILSKKPGLVYSQTQLLPKSTLPIKEIGYNYKVSFDIVGADETPGTVLFENKDAKFYLSDPITGLMGYARDGYLYSFNYKVLPNEKVNIVIEGDNKGVKLYANGKLIEDKNITNIYFRNKHDEKKYAALSQVKTLVFPLWKTGDFKAKISDLKVYQQ